MNTLARSVAEHVRRVSDDPVQTLAVSRDLWPRGTLALAKGGLPEPSSVVCWPEQEAELVALLRWAHAAGVPVVPYGAGSGVCGGAAGRNEAVVVDTKGLRELTIHADDRFVTAGAGWIGQHLEDVLERQGLATRHSPSSIWCSSVGGWAAARSAGQFSSQYGKFEDMTLGLRAVTPCGVVDTGQRVPRGAEDLGHVLMGSEGTLGVISAVDIRIVPTANSRWLRGYSFPSVPAALACMQGIMQAGLHPSVMRLYDPVDALIGGKHGDAPGKPSVLQSWFKQLDQQAWFRGLELALPFALPRLVNAIASGVGSRCVLVLGFEGDADVVASRSAAVAPWVSAAEDLGAEPGERWYAHRHNVSYKLAPIFLRNGFADTMEVAASWSCFDALHKQVRAAIGRRAVVMAHMSHAYPEGCSIYFSFAGKGSLKTYDALWEDALAAAIDAGGTCTHHHGVGLLKAKAARREVGHAHRVFERRKAQLDPGGVMNPGRVYAGEAPTDRGPAPPEGEGPVWGIAPESLIASVDPRAAPADVQSTLREAGYRMRVLPDRPLGAR